MNPIFTIKHNCNKEELIETTTHLDYGSHKFTVKAWKCPKCDNIDVDTDEYEQVLKTIRDIVGSTNIQD